MYDLHGIDVGDPAVAERVADAMIEGGFFAGSVGELSGAVDAALAHGKLHPHAMAISHHTEQDLLAFLRRLRAALDRRRPWPPPTRGRHAPRPGNVGDQRDGPGPPAHGSGEA